MKPFDIVAFDLDSTLVTIEGLDWLSEKKGMAEEIKALTTQAMDGKIQLEEAMIKRLDILSPSLQDLEELGAAYCQNIVDGVEETLSILRNLHKELWIVTGGFYPAVLPIAKKLGIPKKNIVSNNLTFSNNKKFQSLDLKSPLLKNGGKIEAVKKIVNKSGRTIAFVGDSITDLDVKNDVDLFIGFGGVIQREIVKQNAEIYITDSNMKHILPHIISKQESQFSQEFI